MSGSGADREATAPAQDRAEGGGVPGPTRGPAVYRALDVVEAVLWIGLLVVGSLVALAILRPESQRPPPPEPLTRPSIEAEDMRVAAKSREFTFWLQPTGDFPGGRWSKDGHMFAFRTRKGDWIDLELPSHAPGPYRLELLLTRSADYGTLAVSFNGARLGDPIDLWSGYGVAPSGPVDLGVVQTRGSADVLRLEVIGTNPKASPPYFQFGIDGVRLTEP